jgi:hypothetical protein
LPDPLGRGREECLLAAEVIHQRLERNSGVRCDVAQRHVRRTSHA